MLTERKEFYTMKGLAFFIESVFYTYERGIFLEKEVQIQENKMGVMPVGRLLLTMSVPMMISMLVQAL